jgi:hypothetical protein
VPTRSRNVSHCSCSGLAATELEHVRHAGRGNYVSRTVTGYGCGTHDRWFRASPLPLRPHTIGLAGQVFRTHVPGLGIVVRSTCNYYYVFDCLIAHHDIYSGFASKI